MLRCLGKYSTLAGKYSIAARAWINIVWHTFERVNIFMDDGSRGLKDTAYRMKSRDDATTESFITNRFRQY